MRLAEADQEACAEGVLGQRERLACKLTQEVVRELGGVELCKEDEEERGSGQGKALGVLQGLYGNDLSTPGVNVVLASEAEDSDGEFDRACLKLEGDSRR